MISGIDLSAVVNYTLSNDKENPTIWKLGILPSDVLGKISSGVSKATDIEAAYEILSVSLRGWENFNIPYETESRVFCGRTFNVVPMSLLAQIPLAAVTELTQKCVEINGLTIGERKN